MEKEIKVGMKVRRIRGEHNNMEVGDEDIIIKLDKYTDRYYIMNLKKYGRGHASDNFVIYQTLKDLVINPD